ncbi:MAG: SDR family NAD(P)-dependent oxidoreductase [Gammaproteobacteria bacterium]|nr:SDR family NAD(P)-dependent oxidoreductase [Gammaproteobacteria bacterium]
MGAGRAVIAGCGDIGRRIAGQLLGSGYRPEQILACVSTEQSADQCREMGLPVLIFDLDLTPDLPIEVDAAELYYLVPPQKQGQQDLRSRVFTTAMTEQGLTPGKIVLISTTGVYGDCQGEWVTELSPLKPATDRGLRRLDAEQQWRQWSRAADVGLNILRVPGIYAHSRIPHKRLANAEPVVRPEECGYSNRIHADDLAQVAIAAMCLPEADEVFNATDGAPGKISEYLQAAAQVAGLPPLPEISMQTARQQLSAGMLSYLGESRKISNRKMLQQLKVALRHPDFRTGLRH